MTKRGAAQAKLSLPPSAPFHKRLAAVPRASRSKATEIEFQDENIDGIIGINDFDDKDDEERLASPAVVTKLQPKLAEKAGRQKMKSKTPTLNQKAPLKKSAVSTMPTTTTPQMSCYSSPLPSVTNFQTPRKQVPSVVIQSPSRPRGTSRSAWPKHLRFYVLIFSLQFVTNLGFYLSALPLVRLFEREICQHYYGSTDNIAEAMCKLPASQDKLAYILELKDAFDALPGQKSVVHSLQPSNLLDQAFFYLYGFSHIKAPPEILWFAAAFCFIGVSLVYSQIIYTAYIVSAQFLSLAFATNFATSIVAPLIVAAIMKHLLFLFCSLSFIGVRFALLWSLPETAPSLVGFASIPNDDQALHAGSGVVDRPSLSFEPGEDGGDQISELTKHTEPHSRVFKSILDVIHRPQLQFYFLAVLFKRIAF
ncbi:hypothetical protein MMC31_005219 [Peltigera leucophlebia]|nr:hypothetical protein [Peltigera leucophlebia]